jgi:uncharacterized YigZ family protein
MIEVKKSKFISYIVEYKNFSQTLKQLKLKHQKARHIIYAYRYLNEYNQIVENSSDDGEPKGVAGRPTLTVIQGHDLINTVIITIRYFGGIKLGMGGMVRAYSDSANEVLNSCELLEYIEYCYESIEVEYSNLSIVEYECKKLGIIIDTKSFEDRVKLTLKGAKNSLNAILDIVS